MTRTTVDKIISYIGLAMTVLLIVAGGLMTWASTFVAGQVHDQLAAQKITMPSGAALATPEMKQYLSQYAGQEMTTGAQAEAYADHYIQIHMNEASGGKTYAEISSEQMAMSKSANPDQTQLANLTALKNTLFQGNTLRSMLLNAYAFGTMATIMSIGAIASWIGAAVMLVLSFLGLAHSKRVAASAGAPTTA